MILYHANCWDGFCAAWIAHRIFGDKEEYIPVQYGQQPPNVIGKKVYIVDFSYKKDILLNMIKDAYSICILDHHKTAKEDLQDIPTLRKEQWDCQEGHKVYIKFDMSKSGGRLTWEHFYGEQPSPWLVDYTEDRDLWLWKLKNSKEINAALRSYPLDFKLWDQWYDQLPLPLVNEGTAILRREQQIINDHISHAREIELDGHKILSVNATLLFSEIAGKLAENRPFGAAYFIREDGLRQWSLRSTKDGIDVSEIAKKHGGGGHKNAAGFEE